MIATLETCLKLKERLIKTLGTEKKKSVLHYGDRCDPSFYCE